MSIHGVALLRLLRIGARHEWRDGRVVVMVGRQRRARRHLGRDGRQPARRGRRAARRLEGALNDGPTLVGELFGTGPRVRALEETALVAKL